MRTKTLFSLMVLCGSTAALANLPSQQNAPLQNDMTNEGVPAPDATAPETTAPAPDTTAPETQSNTTDVEPSADTATDPTTDGTETPPNATY